MANTWNKVGLKLESSKYLNDISDPVVGGTLTGVPTGLSLGAGGQTLLGDHLVLDEASALALSDTSVGTLYGGYYQYVWLDGSSTATGASGGLKVGQALFWNKTTTATNFPYNVTNIESGNYPCFAGVAINGSATTSTAMFIQNLGRAVVQFRATINNTGAAALDPVFLAGAGAGADNALFEDKLKTYAITAADMPRYVGISVSAPTDAGTSIVDLQNVFLRF